MMNTTKRPNRKEIGRIGEQAALSYCIEQGFRILERNWRCRKGELDLIVQHSDVIIFVEVRTRVSRGGSASTFGTPQESIDFRKQKQVRDVAAMYLHYRGWHERHVQFDAICVLLNQDLSLKQLEHIETAF